MREIPATSVMSKTPTLGQPWSNLVGHTGRQTGFWHEEFAAPYFVFRDADAQIPLVSPKGRQPLIDPKSDLPENQTDAMSRFKKDPAAQPALVKQRKAMMTKGDQLHSHGMNLLKLQRVSGRLRALHWRRGLRAGLAVAVALIVCRIFGGAIGWASGWAALGGFEAILVDNGGPYRSRFATIGTLMVAGTVACLLVAIGIGKAPFTTVLTQVLVTAIFCFIVTFARVVAQPIASSSVIILVIYFVALGSSTRSLRQAVANAVAFVMGGLWAAALSLGLWPVDPFRPARRAVADCYELLARLTSSIQPTEPGSEQRELTRRLSFECQRQMRVRMEVARAALGTTTARAPSRTIRARNLTVLLETADMLFADAIRMTELILQIQTVATVTCEGDHLVRLVHWLGGAEASIALELRNKSQNGSASNSTPGDPHLEEIRREINVAAANSSRSLVLGHLADVERDALQNIEIAYEAVKAVWSGVELRSTSSQIFAAANTNAPSAHIWVEALRANWTLDSTMMRHALRMTVVGAVDVLLLWTLHLSHGFWLAMTSIIVLQPYQSHTLKRGMERVGGTIAGGVLAAVLAALISSPTAMIAAITVTSVLTLATYAVDYAWYCFFLTPTFVLLSLPHQGDWQYSGVRIFTTALGAAIAVAAMRLLWPEREHLTLGRLLARTATAESEYLRAVLRYWSVVAPADTYDERTSAKREIIAPARRLCGLASNDAEESLDRLMLEPGTVSSSRIPSVLASPSSDPALLIKEHALTFVTYVRRLTQSITTLAEVGRGNQEWVARLESLAERLETVSSALQSNEARMSVQSELFDESSSFEANNDMAQRQMQRMQRQVLILERAVAGMLGGQAAGEELPART